MENFVKQTDAAAAELLADNQGYVIFAYNEIESNSQESTFSFKGNVANVAECLYTCMKQNPMLANVILAASNAYSHYQMMAANMQTQTEPEKKKKRTSKKSK